MEGILITILGAGSNALAFVGTNYTFSKSGCGAAVAVGKRHDLAEENLYRVRDKCNKSRIKLLDFNDKACVKRMKHEHQKTMLAKQCFSTIDYLQNI